MIGRLSTEAHHCQNIGFQIIFLLRIRQPGDQTHQSILGFNNGLIFCSSIPPPRLSDLVMQAGAVRQCSCKSYPPVPGRPFKPDISIRLEYHIISFWDD